MKGLIEVQAIISPFTVLNSLGQKCFAYIYGFCSDYCCLLLN